MTAVGSTGRPTAREAVAEGWQDEWNDWLLGWREALHVARSPQTVTTYLRGARQFLDWLAAHAPEADAPERVTSRYVDGWLASLAREGRGPAARAPRQIKHVQQSHTPHAPAPPDRWLSAVMRHHRPRMPAGHRP